MNTLAKRVGYFEKDIYEAADGSCSVGLLVP
jgi:hypothetical protein